MGFHPSRPYNDLPDLPPPIDLETKAVLNACVKARAALAALRQVSARYRKIADFPKLILPAGDERQLARNLPDGSRLGMRLAGPCANEPDTRGVRLR